MKLASTKIQDQLDPQTIHRMRYRLVRQRASVVNQIRTFLLERGLAVRQGSHFLPAELGNILATPIRLCST